MDMFTHGIEHRFITRPTLELVRFGTDPGDLIDQLVRSETVEIDPERFYPSKSD